MKKTAAGISVAATLAAFGFTSAAHGATVLVDWLELSAGGSTSSFSLAADGGLPVVHGALAIEAGKGIAFPGFPTARNFNSAFWAADTGFTDTVTANRNVTGFDLRVAPQSGMAAYSLTLEVPAGRELIVAIGGLYRGSAGATQAIAASAFSDAGSAAVTLSKLVAWDGGSGAFDQELEWSAGTGTLSTTVGSEGDSEIAFLHIAPLTGANRKVVLSVANGYPTGTGDSLSFAIGTVIPEPGTVLLAGLGAVCLLAPRRR